MHALQSGLRREGSYLSVTPGNRSLARIHIAIAWKDLIFKLQNKGARSSVLSGLLALLLQRVWCHTLDWWTVTSLMLCRTQLHYGMETPGTGFAFSSAKSLVAHLSGLVSGLLIPRDVIPCKSSFYHISSSCGGLQKCLFQWYPKNSIRISKGKGQSRQFSHNTVICLSFPVPLVLPYWDLNADKELENIWRESSHVGERGGGKFHRRRLSVLPECWSSWKGREVIWANVGRADRGKNSFYSMCNRKSLNIFK